MAVESARIEELLNSTPYVAPDDSGSVERFSRVARKALATHDRAKQAARDIASQASRILGPYESTMRSELVAESNRMEGYDSTTEGVRDLVRVREDLLHIEIQHFVESIRKDPKLLENLGLYRAYMLADDWAGESQRPREYELRSLHSLIMGPEGSGGTYKRAPNRIGGSAHTPIAPWDVGRSMAEFCDWFVEGSGDPLLDAAVAHAWLTHIHPFDDGNGRMARLLANLALIQAEFPPLLLRADSVRGQYYDALAASDDGDILPLYDLFAAVLRKMVREMERPQFVERKVRAELLETTGKRYEMWKPLMRTFFTTLEHKVARPHGCRLQLMGYPLEEEFCQLEEGDRDGKTWWAKVRRRGEGEKWLLWFGVQSPRMKEFTGSLERSWSWPSVYFSAFDNRDPALVQPWKQLTDEVDRPCPTELVVAPGTHKPVILRAGLTAEELDLTDGAAALAAALCE